MVRTLIVSNGLLLSSAIECLLSHEEDLFVATTNKGRVHHLLEEVDLVQPDVVIIDNHNFHQNSHVLGELLKQHPRLRLLVVDQKQNFVYLYEKKEIPILVANDFVHVIKMN